MKTKPDENRMISYKTLCDILNKLAFGNIFQPATLFWRLFEIEALVQKTRMRGRILDLGCGDGRVSSTIFSCAQHSCNKEGPNALIGIDPDVEDSAFARRNGFYEKVYTCSASAIPEENGSFDFCFANSVIEHIPDIEEVLLEVSRVLRANGKFIFTVPSTGFDTLMKTSRFWAEKFSGGNLEEYSRTMNTRLAVYHYFDHNVTEAMLRNVGLGIIQEEYYFPESAVRIWESISNHTAGYTCRLFGPDLKPHAIQKKTGLLRLQYAIPRGVQTTILSSFLRPKIKKVLENAEHDEIYGGYLVIAQKLSFA
ncbi:MAG: methyltransferase domain-containing protein [candidate division Zixibacteria bacterium]|nr:methyltransferase domain-containing protein [candidate division Zixibacteria bacterium]